MRLKTMLAAALLCASLPGLQTQAVKDPIGITGWPKEKGRDGERTPMQWNTSNRQAGFSTDAQTWLPVPASYVSLNVATEQQDPTSQLHWYEQLIAMRRTMPALHDGGLVMLDSGNPDVLSFVRTVPAGAKPVVVSLNMSAAPQTVTLDLTPASLHAVYAITLLTDAPTLEGKQSLQHLTVPPYTSWMGNLQ